MLYPMLLAQIIWKTSVARVWWLAVEPGVKRILVNVIKTSLK